MSKRKTFQDKWLAFLDEMKLPPRNRIIYEKWFATLSDSQFHNIMELCRDKKMSLPVYKINGLDPDIDIENVMSVGSKYGIEWYNRLLLTDHITDEEYLTEAENIVLRLPVRRLKEHLVKKRSTANSNKVIDDLTGQVTGDSKTASMSAPELMVVNNKGHYFGILELIKLRGGDADARSAMLDQLRTHGEYSIQPILDEGTQPKIVTTLNKFYRAMMLDSNW